MKIELTGNALKLFEDFLHYATTNQDELADAMYYDYDAFSNRVAQIKKAYNKAGNFS